MAIIKYTKEATEMFAYLNVFPDQFKTEKQKQNEGYIKNTMDFFANKAFAQYTKNKNGFAKNYDLVKGILRAEDFYQDEDVKTFADILEEDLKLPTFVKNYSIITTPLNELNGEVSKRPDLYRVKAFDDDSRSQELKYKTDTLTEYVMQQARMKIIEQANLEGAEIDPEELEQRTLAEVKDDLDSYTSVAERWSNITLTAQKVDFNSKELSEEAFRDLLISSQQYYHLYEDNSKVGFNIEVANPKNVWNLIAADKKWTSDPTGRNQGAYASGVMKVMELSEIIELVPEITMEEIDHLRSSVNNFGLPDIRESNLGRDVGGGTDTITYDTYDPLVLQTRMMMSSELGDVNDELTDFLGVTSNVSSFGNKYVVLRAYWASKKKIGKLQYVDDFQNVQSIIVDETYKPYDVPTQISLDWGWVNQWYQGIKIGNDVYHMKPFKLLNYNPIIGLHYEPKNTELKSLVDLMKPFQVMYNVCMNQMFKLLEKEFGNVGVVNVRRVPRVKDGDGQDDIDIFELEAKERGIMFDDDSPENTKAPVSNQSVIRNVDLTRSNEIQSRYNLAIQLKNECWELIGMSKQRMGSVSASESATGTNAALAQSYTQTEPLFVAHEYNLGHLYQAIIDASLYIESEKPESTVSYINSEGTSAFVKVNGSDLKFRDIKVFATNRPEDNQLFNEARQMSQSILQNGGSVHDVLELYSTKSIRDMKKTFRKVKEEADAKFAQQQELENKKLEQQQQQYQQTLEEAKLAKEAEAAREDYQKELDRQSNEKVAIIKATGFGQVESEDTNNNNVPDVLEMSKISLQESKANKEYNAKLGELALKNKAEANKLTMKREDNAVTRENMRNDLQIAKENSKNRSKK